MDNLPFVTDSLDGIDEEFKELYSKQEDGSFSFQKPQALLNSKNHEKQKGKETKAAFNEIQERMKALEDERKAEKDAAEAERQRIEMESHRKKGDFEALEKSWQEKNAKISEDFQSQLDQRNSIIGNLTVGQAAQSLASKLAGEDAHLILPALKQRLRSEINDGRASTRVLDTAGNPSALTLDELRTEFYNDKQYSRIIVGSNGSGGGADGSNAKGGGSSQKTITRAAYEAIPLGDRPNLKAEGISLKD
tara:strand:- start:76 stop:822 length:747 start_codon:yes stop_codon:yes gene_type:complete